MTLNKTLHFNSEEQNLFFTSDTHFQHANIIKYCNRPFKTRDEMDSTMIKNWNSVVGKDDIIFVLGDFCFGGNKTWQYISAALNGNKVLIWGYHDKSFAGTWIKIDNIINLLIDDHEIKDGQRITLCHYPMLSWYQSHRGSWQLFGHVHGRPVPITPTQLDVGVDVHNFTPISYDEVKTIITKQHMK